MTVGFDFIGESFNVAVLIMLAMRAFATASSSWAANNAFWQFRAFGLARFLTLLLSLDARVGEEDVEIA